MTADRDKLRAVSPELQRRLPPAVEVLCQALETELPAEFREDIAQLLAKLARRHGLRRNGDELLILFRDAPPAHRGHVVPITAGRRGGA